MNRRGFLKFLGIGAGTVVVAPTVIAESRSESSPNIVFTYEPQDKDIDQFLTGPFAGANWIGGDESISGKDRPDPLLLSCSERRALMRAQIREGVK